jgi:hypothetical protein
LACSPILFVYAWQRHHNPSGNRDHGIYQRRYPLDANKFVGSGLSSNHSTSVTSDIAQIEISSTPPGADIDVDGSFVGNTPSNIQVAAGQHTIVIKKSDFKNWERKLSINAGSNIHLDADMEKSMPQ